MWCNGQADAPSPTVSRTVDYVQFVRSFVCVYGVGYGVKKYNN